MAAKTRADIQTEIDALLANNTTGDISPTDVRTVHETSKDSNLNLTDLTAQQVEAVTNFEAGVKENGHIIIGSSNQVVIRSESDWPAVTDDAGVDVHKLEAKEYIIDGAQSHANPLSPPGAGLTAVIKHIKRDILTYSGPDAQFYGTDAEGNIEIAGLTHYKAPSGSFFDLTAVTGSFSFQAAGGAFRFEDCNSIGIMSGNGVSGFNLDFGSIFDFDQGLILENMNFQEMNRTLMFGNNAVGSVYITSQGASTAGSVSYDKVTFSNGTNETAFDFKTAIQSGVDNIAISGCLEEGGINGAVFAPGSLTNKSNKVIANANSIMGDSIPGGLLSLTDNATETIISAVNTPTLVLGTWVVEDESQFTGNAAGRLTYNDARDISAAQDVSISVQPASGNGKVIRAYVAKNGTEITNSGKSVTADNGKPALIAINWREDTSTTNFYEIFVENKTDAINIIATDGTLRIP